MAKGIDWDFIRSEYEETTKSERTIALENNISHGAIQSRRSKDKKNGNGWVRSNYMDVIHDKALTNPQKPILKRTALRKVKEIKHELGDNYSVLDEPLIAAFALNYEKWIGVQEILLEEKSIEMSSKGSLYISPYENLAKMYENSFIKISAQLGLSIASRKRLNLAPKSDTEESSLFDLIDEIDQCEVDI